MKTKTKTLICENIEPCEVVLTLSPKGKQVLIALLENAIKAIEVNKMHDAASIGILAYHLGMFAMYSDSTVEEPILKFDAALDGEWFDHELSALIQGQYKTFWQAIDCCGGAS